MERWESTLCVNVCIIVSISGFWNDIVLNMYLINNTVAQFAINEQKMENATMNNVFGAEPADGVTDLIISAARWLLSRWNYVWLCNKFEKDMFARVWRKLAGNLIWHKAE